MADTKQCFKCNQWLTRDCFYAHKKMGDGLLGKCKECTKLDVRTNYSATREKRSAYEHSAVMRAARDVSVDLKAMGWAE